MSMAEREQYLKDNPDVKQMISKVAFSYGSGNTQGIKVDNGFREVQQKIASTHKAHNMKMF